MTTQLSSLLVRDGLVPPKGMVTCFEHQVIKGGSLDTILLELGLVEDHRIEQYLSLASGVPAAAGEWQRLDPESAALCSEEMSEKFQVVPLGHDDDTLRVLVKEKLGDDSKAALSEATDYQIKALIVPEYRFWAVRTEVYGGTLAERFALLCKLSKQAMLPTDDTQKVEDTKVAKVQAIPTPIVSEITQPADASDRVRGTRAPADPPERRQTKEFATQAIREQFDSSDTNEEEALDQADQDSQSTASSETKAQDQSSSPDSEDLDESLQIISADRARDLLASSEDRDEIFLILLRAMRRRLRHTALFTVKGTEAKGRLSLGEDGLDQGDSGSGSITELRLPLAALPRLTQVVESGAFSVGPLESTNEEAELALKTLGAGEVPNAGIVLPISIGGRVIAIALGHNYEKRVNVGSMTDLLPLATSTSDAINRLLTRLRSEKQGGKSASTGKATEAKAKKSKKDATSDEEQSVGESSSSVPVPDSAMSALFARLEGDDFEAAKEEALKEPAKALAHLYFGFPGKLHRERKAEDSRLKAAEHGPVLALVVALGEQAGEALSEKMRDANREVRYYATLCASEIRPSAVVNELVERLFDGDESIRNLAVETLAAYPDAERQTALDFARRALHSEDNARLKVAADGLCRLGDVSAIPDLLDAHSRGGDAAEISRSALFLLTNQDFGKSNRKWRTWWEDNNDKKRVEWMLEGLGHKSADVRKNAVETLREITGQYFGYGHDLTKKEREKARKMWAKWLNQNP